MRLEFNDLKVIDVRKETADCVSISFDTTSTQNGNYNYIPGQYLTLKKEINGEEVRRSYSICSAPHDKELRVAVKEITNGKFSGFANNELKVNDVLSVMQPTGNFTTPIDSSNSNKYLFIAVGSGITPIMSMIKSILEVEKNSSITLVYGNKTSNSIIFKEELSQLDKNNSNLNIIHSFSQEKQDDYVINGRITSDNIKSLNSDLNLSSFSSCHLCGPEEMILSSKETLIELGLAKENIHFELFTTSAAIEDKPAEVNPDAEIISEVTIIIDDEEYNMTLSSKGKDILEAGEQTGADLPFSCKGGVCCTCRAKVMEGSATMNVNYALEPDEVEEGYILTCQAHPSSEKLVVSFDE
jgi:ring-1,2-phenylacetyl-CoA epoxidase subunit PaaE